MRVTHLQDNDVGEVSISGCQLSCELNVYGISDTEALLYDTGRRS